MSTPATTAQHTIVREAREADLPRLLELLHQLAELSSLPDDGIAPPDAVHRQALVALRSDPRATCLVLDVGDRVEGTLTLYLLPNLSHGARPLALVENVVVDRSLRGHGYGRLLMDHAERLAWQHGCYRVVLTSNNRRTDAHRFYEQIGYDRSHQGFTKHKV